MQEPAHQAPVNPDRSVKLPEFCGEVDIDKMSVMEYISAVEMSRIAGNWSDSTQGSSYTSLDQQEFGSTTGYGQKRQG
jgi:hypothetical protein